MEQRDWLRVVGVNYNDLRGRAFNGYDLHLSLNERDDVSAIQYVVDKYSDTPSVKAFDKDEVIHQELRYLERKYSIPQLLMPYGRQLLQEEDFQQADIVHLQILHVDTISLLDLPEIMARDNVVWTIHDPWIVTGNCLHPLQCGKWRTGCRSCGNLLTDFFPMKRDYAAQMWSVKQKILAGVNPYIVIASQFTENYIRTSPLTAHWNRIYHIPFGIKDRFLQDFDPWESKARLQIAHDCLTVGCRGAKDLIKGFPYILEALEQLNTSIPIQLLIVGEHVELPEGLRQRHRCVEFTWLQEDGMLDFYRAADIFIMPSLAETFGLMAIEAMACQTAVICFQATVLEEVTGAPDYGIAVEYKSAEGIAAALTRLLDDPEELERRKQSGRQFAAQTYPYNLYVQRHLQLYQEIKRREHGQNTHYRRTL